MAAKKGKGRPIHKVSFESMMAWGCLCGARWMNEHLRGKSDEDLIVERDEAFARHEREMERQGF
jgi:hypothetical protein